MDDLYSELINLLQFSTGRRRYAYAGVLALLKDSGQPALVAFVEQGIARDEEAAALEQRYATDRALRAAPHAAAVGLDHHFDRTLSAIGRRLDDLSMLFAANTDTGRRARHMALVVLPEGVAAITRLPFEDEVAAGHDLVKKLRGALAGDVTALDLGLLVAELERSVDVFAAEFGRVPDLPVRFDAVRAARAGGQRHLERLVAKLLASDELDETTRRRVLAPVLEQNARIRSWHVRHRAVPDVDPATGQELAAAGDVRVAPAGKPDGAPQPSPAI